MELGRLARARSHGEHVGRALNFPQRKLIFSPGSLMKILRMFIFLREGVKIQAGFGLWPPLSIPPWGWGEEYRVVGMIRWRS